MLIESLIHRPRRLRRTESLRNLVQETHLKASNFILPLFIHHELQQKKAIQSMPGHYQLGLDHLEKEIEEIVELKIPGVMVFGIPREKDDKGTDAYQENGIIQLAIQKIKKLAPHLLVFSDCCFCEYMDHGHCGIISHTDQDLDNDATLEILAKAAVAQAKAGADVIAPSGMIDGMVGALRVALDENGFEHIPILSYAIKYASSLYGPFREAAEGAPKFGDRRSYQMNPANASEALLEAQLDIEQGADILMIKPATFYLDILHKIKHAFPEVPLAAYQVSGEFAMLKAAIEKGWLQEQVIYESLLAIKRAGANFIITYFAKEILRKCGNIINS